MSIKLGFGILDEKPSTGESELLPQGWYNGYINNLELVENKNKTGKNLKATFEVTTGFYKGVMVNKNFSIYNPSEQAQVIARADLSAIGVAIGIPNNDDAEILLRKPLKFKVKIEPYTKDGQIRFSNQLCGYRNMNTQLETVETKTDIEYPDTKESQSIFETPAYSQQTKETTWFQQPNTPPNIQLEQPVVPEILGATPPVQSWEQPVQTTTVKQPQPVGFDPNKKPTWMQQT